MFNVSLLCKQSIRLFQQKLCYKLISPHMHYLFINKMRYYLVDINVFAKFDEIPSLPVQVIKEKPKCQG